MMADEHAEVDHNEVATTTTLRSIAAARRVMGKWCGSFGPTAKHLLGLCVAGADDACQRTDDDVTDNLVPPMYVRLEAVGSCLLIVRRLGVSKHDTVQQLQQSAAAAHPHNHVQAADMKLFAGHGGTELVDRAATLESYGIGSGDTIAVGVEAVPKPDHTGKFLLRYIYWRHTCIIR